jgi:cytochrome c oxidase subunit 4
MSQKHIASVATNLIVFVALMVLLLATIGGAYAPLGHFHLAVALLIAVAKALLVMLFYMHVRSAKRTTWVFSSAAFLWLGILIALSLSDYLGRGWLAIPGK